MSSEGPALTGSVSSGEKMSRLSLYFFIGRAAVINQDVLEFTMQHVKDRSVSHIVPEFLKQTKTDFMVAKRGQYTQTNSSQCVGFPSIFHTEIMSFLYFIL